MKILVVDAEPSFSALLTRALRRLGHSTGAAASGSEAAAIAGEGYDAVIIALELPDLDGIELAAVLRGSHDELAIAFHSGMDDGLALQASRVGRVLPRVWTVATLRELVEVLDRDARKLARGTGRAERWSAMPTAVSPLQLSARMRPAGSAPPPNSGIPGLTLPPGPLLLDLPSAESDGSGEPADATAEARPMKVRSSLRKIRLSCRSWEQVERLCAQHAAGKTVLTLRGSHGLELHEPLIVALALPDELVLSLRAEVMAIRHDDTGTPAYAVGLTGLTDAVIARLEHMVAAANGDLNARPTRRLPRAQSDISFA